MSDLVITGPGPETLVIVEQDTAFLGFTATGLPGLNGKDAVGLVPLPFGKAGPMDLSVGAQRFYVDYDVVLLGGRAALGTPPSGSAFTLAVRVDDVPTFTLVVADGAHDSGHVDFGSVPISAGSYFSVDRTAIGSLFPGADLTATLWMKALA